VTCRRPELQGAGSVVATAPPQGLQCSRSLPAVTTQFKERYKMAAFLIHSLRKLVAHRKIISTVIAVNDISTWRFSHFSTAEIDMTIWNFRLYQCGFVYSKKSHPAGETFGEHERAANSWGFGFYCISRWLGSGPLASHVNFHVCMYLGTAVGAYC
jgi:hypothetical protein